jgi:hypothetical protein
MYGVLLGLLYYGYIFSYYFLVFYAIYLFDEKVPKADVWYFYLSLELGIMETILLFYNNFE